MRKIVGKYQRLMSGERRSSIKRRLISAMGEGCEGAAVAGKSMLSSMRLFETNYLIKTKGANKQKKNK